jgi:hypothetical protein
MHAVSVALLAVLMSAPLAHAEWLARGSKAWAPTVFSKRGIGTEHAVAEARATREEIQGWCENWSPGDADCVRREMASEDARRVFRATADCKRGRITTIYGETYTLAGRWDHSDIGGGRTRWRDAAGRIVGRDNASGGLGIAQQWEVLCPEKAAAPATPRTPAPGARPAPVTPPPAAVASFAVGEIVYARYGPAWVRGRVTRISRVAGANGPEFAYNVSLDNGERGVLPARMMRKAPQR